MKAAGSTRELYRIENLPVFQNSVFPTRESALACPRGDVVLVEDSETGLIYNQAFRPELMKYDTNYQNEQSVSGAFRRHIEEVKAIIARCFSGASLLEVGCGKGYFLNYLRESGFRIKGYDPAYEGADPDILKEAFRPGLGIRAEGLILRHVLEHIQDPLRFLSSLSEANEGTGRIYIEVPCFEWICDRRAWFDIFYEHVNYFRLSDFSRIFGDVIEAGHLFHGQYMYAVAELSSLRKPEMKSWEPAKFPTDFQASLEAISRKLKADRTQGKKAVVWGGSSKGLVFSLLMQRKGVEVDAVIDINPAKQGMFLPGCGIQISAPEKVIPHLPKNTDVYVMNSNYLAEIREQTKNQFNYITVDHE